MTGRITPLRIVAAIAAIVAAIAMRGLSIVPLAGAPADRAMLRLSWSARPERVERCRRLSDEELAQRPAHMQLRFECEGHFARYLLNVRVGERLVADDTLRGGGFRNDRPIHVLEEYDVTPGTHRIRVEVARIDTVAPPPEDREEGAERRDDPAEARADSGRRSERDAREVAERSRRAMEALPSHVVLDSTVTIPSRGVVLVTYEPDAHRFVFKGSR